MKYEQLFTNGLYGGRWDIPFHLTSTDRILDIGGGDRPYPLSTDVIDKDSPEAEIQRGNNKMYSKADKKIWNGYAEEILPLFANKEIDFVYSAHTLEHTSNLPFVLSEINRTCKRGFIILPHYYMDLWACPISSGHKWFFSYNHKINKVYYRRRLPFEYIKELTDIQPSFLDWRNNIIQGHYNNLNVRALWEIRFYWEDQIDFEEDLDIYEESLYRSKKFMVKPEIGV